MNPELNVFLDEAFQSIEPTSPTIGRVVIVPDFEMAADPRDRDKLAEELSRFLREQSLHPADGVDIPISNKYALLAKYVRAITLHQEPPPEGAWVEVVPPGNWI